MKKTALLLFCLFASVIVLSQTPHLLKNLTSTSFVNSYPQYFTEYKGNVIFTAWSDSTVTESEVWITNGTSAGTKILKDIGDKEESSYPSGYHLFKDKIYFKATSGKKNGLWTTDGTTAGTIKIKDVAFDIYELMPYSFVEFKDRLYFQSADYESAPKGQELWVTDGSTTGTYMVKDISIGMEGSYPNSFTVYKDKLYFQANDGINGAELWVSDGTDAGTYMLKDIYPGAAGSVPARLFTFKDKLYFIANDPVYGFELWISDGTATGTEILKDIYPGSNSSVPLSNLSAFVFKDKFYFSANDGTNGHELWCTDGTKAGTTLVKNINLSGDAHPSNFCEYDNKFYFQADDGINGKELWVSDGTDVGTSFFLDLNRGQDGLPNSLIVYDSLLYFVANVSSAYAPTYDYQLWVSDGDPVNTKIIYPAGTAPLNPLDFSFQQQLFVCSNKLYSCARFDDSIGYEPYIINTIPLSVATADQKDLQLSVYPNPAAQKLTLNAAAGIHAVRVTDISGKQLSEYRFNGLKTVEIDLKNLANGTYIMEVRSEDAVVRKQIIVRHS